MNNTFHKFSPVFLPLHQLLEKFLSGFLQHSSKFRPICLDSISKVFTLMWLTPDLTLKCTNSMHLIPIGLTNNWTKVQYKFVYHKTTLLNLKLFLLNCYICSSVISSVFRLNTTTGEILHLLSIFF